MIGGSCRHELALLACVGNFDTCGNFQLTRNAVELGSSTYTPLPYYFIPDYLSLRFSELTEEASKSSVVPSSLFTVAEVPWCSSSRERLVRPAWWKEEEEVASS